MHYTEIERSIWVHCIVGYSLLHILENQFKAENSNFLQQKR